MPESPDAVSASFGATAPRQGNCRGRASRYRAVPGATSKRASCGASHAARPLAAPADWETASGVLEIVGKFSLSEPRKSVAWKPAASGRALADKPPSELGASRQGPGPDALHPAPRDTKSGPAARHKRATPFTKYREAFCDGAARAVSCPREAGLSCPLEAAAMRASQARQRLSWSARSAKSHGSH